MWAVRGFVRHGARRSSALAQIDAKKLIITKTTTPKPKPDFQKVAFGTQFTDHMLKIDWDANNGWHAPHIEPYGPLVLDPSVSSLHYALQGFEGMKAYKDTKQNVRLFRPMMNMKRLNSTAERLSLPTFDGAQFLECIKDLVRLDRDWVPNESGYSLYIRPTIISTHAALGVSSPRSALLYCISGPVGPYYKTGFKAVSLLADRKYVRAWPGGTGSVKCGGNYAATIQPQREAEARGFSQLLWLYGEDELVTEVGTMNQFFFWVNEQGEHELVTTPLDGTILPGVTRDSILSLARQWGEFKVSERHFSIHEVTRAVKEKRVIEAFGAGTAALVCPVKNVHYEGTDYSIPLDPSDSSVEAGPLTRRFLKAITDIQYGRVGHEWSVVL